MTNTAQKMKFSIKDFFDKCDQVCSFMWIWSHLLKKSLMENFFFCAFHIISYHIILHILCFHLSYFEIQCSVQKVFLEILQNSQQFCNFIKKEMLVQVFSCEFCKISNNNVFIEHLWWSYFHSNNYLKVISLYQQVPPRHVITTITYLGRCTQFHVSLRRKIMIEKKIRQ